MCRVQQDAVDDEPHEQRLDHLESRGRQRQREHRRDAVAMRPEPAEILANVLAALPVTPALRSRPAGSVSRLPERARSALRLPVSCVRPTRRPVADAGSPGRSRDSAGARIGPGGRGRVCSERTGDSCGRSRLGQAIRRHSSAVSCFKRSRYCVARAGPLSALALNAAMMCSTTTVPIACTAS